MSAQEDYDSLAGIAERLFGDDDDGKSNYITEHMKRLGHRMRVVFEDNDDDGNDGKGDNFTGTILGGGKRTRQVERNKSAGRQDRRAAGGGFGMNQYQ